MILRRITEHVKAQNWFAVAIDFVIVVVGVFVGIQVSNLNAARQDHARAEQYLERIIQPLSPMSRALTGGSLIGARSRTTAPRRSLTPKKAD